MNNTYCLNPYSNTEILIRQGFVMNLQPSEAEAGFDVRVPPIADQEALERRISEEWAPAARNMTFEVGVACLRSILLLVHMIIQLILQNYF